MKSAIFLACASAMLVSASPLRAPHAKRIMVTDWVVDIVTVTVTAGAEPTAGVVFLEDPAPTTHKRVHHTRRPQPTKVVVTTTAAPEPQVPATTAAPAPEPETTVVEEKPSTTAEGPKTSAAAPVNGDISLDDFQTAVVDHHNLHRSNHSAPALEWDTTLAGYAENTANGCVFAHDMDQGDGGYGQNLASWGTSGDMEGLQSKAAAMGVTNQWYNDEMNNWSFYGQDNPPSGLDLNSFGHFTQLVWKSSTKIGCATVLCPAGTVLSLPSWYTVCNYNPPGNFGGEYGNNVLKPLGGSMVTV
ncbi:Fc.00g059180.m01.CDS01 [Cosmosporella sp. VM-42]